jgi:hypothetical protein
MIIEEADIHTPTGGAMHVDRPGWVHVPIELRLRPQELLRTGSGVRQRYGEIAHVRLGVRVRQYRLGVVGQKRSETESLSFDNFEKHRKPAQRLRVKLSSHALCRDLASLGPVEDDPDDEVLCNPTQLGEQRFVVVLCQSCQLELHWRFWDV